MVDESPDTCNSPGTACCCEGITRPPALGGKPGISKFLTSCTSHFLVELSSFKQLTNVLSFS